MNPGLLTLLFLVLYSFDAEAEEPAVDYSCMTQTVRSKAQFTAEYKEYDVVLRNKCPGPVYWAMCIERIDPVTREIVEIHTPAGYVEADKVARVNLQLKKRPHDDYRNRFQQFYVQTDFAINDFPEAQCEAAACERANRERLAQFNDNEKAVKKSEQALAAQIEASCPTTGWAQDRETCVRQLREAAQEEIDRLRQTSATLRQSLEEIEPAHCRPHGGDLADSP